MAPSCAAVSAKVRASRKARARGRKPRRRNIEAKRWAANQPANRLRPDLNALMAALDAPEAKALKATEAASACLPSVRVNPKR
jgi:hypothetical protein